MLFRFSGVDFLIRNSIISKLENLPTDRSDCITTVYLLRSNQQYATLFSVYSPNFQVDPAEKDKFYSELHSLLQGSPADDKVMIVGDFNARVGQVL
uniref:Endonuclease/exonuclease/phosphatase domain-containing protein n=1 Tax=Octopus bimaculoides TaxID=37653 RepID=A0A0L8G4X1_OCTBM